MPAGKVPGIDGFRELLRHAVEKHPSGQAVPNAVGGKCKRDGDINGEYTAPTAKRTKGDGDGKCPAPAARRIESDGERECPDLPAKRKRAARHNAAYKKELSRVVIYDADSDPYEDVIICVSTLNQQQTCHLMNNYMGSSAALDPEFLGYVDPALLAPWRPANAAYHTAAVISDYQTQEALRRPRRRRGRCYG
ncbi:hypothetical protein C7999DRAFT_35111 [Corynascus novoguineensis]|uniref:Uncharacterized protein n=1 Tax=Corynascus novoguineensis TaxID=1126955 RepID=A0AAN7CLY6_9PEZI|nr:hypothetical protein C7999DRAFT_35111 [Corynascus novoguineensis]